LDKRKVGSNILLLITALIWGSAFVAQRVGMDYVGPFTFGAARFVLATMTLIPVIHFMGKSKNIRNKKEYLTEEEEASQNKVLLKAGVICGVILFCGSMLQQHGLLFTTAGKAGFITALYIVLIPIFSLVLKRIPGLKSWVGVAFGAVGLYLLSITESLTIAPGDFIVLIGAGFWAAHLLVIDYYLPEISDPIRLSYIQFFTCAILCFIGALIFENATLEGIKAGIIPILYAGVLSGGVGFTLQIIGQRYTSPIVASLILSLEAVFAAVFGYFILKEILTTREFVGCVLMFVAIIISQLPDKKIVEKDLELKSTLGGKTDENF
jgi:drug/metabolite transporter (DMT)-like permease